MTVRLPSFSKMKLENLRRLADQHKFILASGSPRRKRILTEVGIPFKIIVPRIEEDDYRGLSPQQLAIDLARRKAESIAIDNRGAILGCDTIVALGDKLLNKPADADDARRILRTLSGKTHSVFTGLALYDSTRKKCHCGVEESRVMFHELEVEAIDRYIASGEPLDKAGAYGIQGIGGFLVDSIEGNIDNVIGLPLRELEHLAGKFLSEYV